jgi:hypothetical protein
LSIVSDVEHRIVLISFSVAALLWEHMPCIAQLKLNMFIPL